MTENATKSRISEVTDDEALAQVLFELADRKRRGQAVDLEAAIAAQPHYAAELRRLFPMMNALAGLDNSGFGSGAPEQAGLLGTIGDYQIIREIGRGGMGIVYEARQISLNRRVALKVLPFAAALDQRSLARFKQESLAAAQLDHPHIVHVHNVGSDRGVHYYAMQYIEGQSLAQVIAEMKDGVEKSKGSKGDDECGMRNAECGIEVRQTGDDAIANSAFRDPHCCDPKSEIRNPKSTRSKSPSTLALRAAGMSTDRVGNRREFHRGVARLGIQIAEALDYAHDRGVLHRDIKPANLLIDDAGQSWITDFGLARIEAETNLTMTGDLMGTLRYSSPEQALGQRGLIDQRTDVYALGATLYELLALTPVFRGENRAELLRQIADQDPLPPRRHDRSVPEELETILLKCLEKEPADRYLTARALADDLERYLAHQPLAAKRATLVERVRKWSHRHQTVVLAGATTITLSTAVFAVSAVWVMHEREQMAIQHGTVREQMAIERGITREQTVLAENRQKLLHQVHYASKINLVHTAWKRGDFVEARRHLGECHPKPGEDDLRGFEWYWLSRTIESTPPAWRRHTGEVYAARFYSDNNIRRLATCGQDRARIWTWPGGEQLAHLTAHAYDVNDLAFSPDGLLLATASDDRTVKVWDASSWNELQTLPHQGMVIAALFSPDGKMLACAERHIPSQADNVPIEVIRMWNVTDWTEVKALVGPAGELHSLSWSPDGETLATGAGGNNELRIWDWKAGTIRYADRYGSCVRCIAFARNRPVLAVAEAAGRSAILNLESQREVAVLPHAAESIQFAPDERSVLTAGRDGIARLYDFTGAGEEMVENVAFRDSSPLWCARFAPDGHTIITTNHDGSIKLWDRQQRVDRQSISGIPGKGWESAVEFAPDGKSLLINNDSLRLIDLQTGSELRSLTGAGEMMGTTAVSSDRNWLATGDRQGRVVLWDMQTWQKRLLREADSEPIDSITFLPGRKLPVVVGTPRQMFMVGDEPGDPMPFPLDILDKASFLVLGADGGIAATLARQFSGRAPLDVWNLRDGTALDVTQAPYYCLAGSPDGRLLAAGDLDGVTRLWSTETWDEPTLLVGHTGIVNAVAIAPDGRTVATCATDNTIKLWHAATGRELLTFEGRLRNPFGLTFSADGTALAVSGMADNEFHHFQVLIWRAAAVRH